MKNNYVIINSDTIQKRIDELNKTFKIKSGEKQALKKLVYSDNTDEILILDTEMYGLEVLLEELQNILSQSIPLNEELEEAFIRELQEEIGIRVLDPKLYRAIIFSNPKGRKKFALIYECEKFTGEPYPAQPEEVKELKWATLEEVKELPLIDEFKPVVIEYLTNLK